jgi:transposase-like protein
VTVLKQLEPGVSLRELCRQQSVTEQSLYNWRFRYCNLEVGLLAELKRPAGGEPDELGNPTGKTNGAGAVPASHPSCRPTRRSGRSPAVSCPVAWRFENTLRNHPQTIKYDSVIALKGTINV